MQRWLHPACRIQYDQASMQLAKSKGLKTEMNNADVHEFRK